MFICLPQSMFNILLYTWACSQALHKWLSVYIMVWYSFDNLVSMCFFGWSHLYIILWYRWACSEALHKWLITKRFYYGMVFIWWSCFHVFLSINGWSDHDITNYDIDELALKRYINDWAFPDEADWQQLRRHEGCEGWQQARTDGRQTMGDLHFWRQKKEDFSSKKTAKETSQ